MRYAISTAERAPSRRPSPLPLRHARRGHGPHPKTSAGESATCRSTPTNHQRRRHAHVSRAAHHAGERVVHPRRRAPPNTTPSRRARRRASRPSPIERYNQGPVVRTVPEREPMTRRDDHRVHRQRVRDVSPRAPSARATAEATPPPIPPADIVWSSITRGKTSETPRAPPARRPTKKASRIDTPLHRHHEHVRRGQPQQRGGNRARPAAGACGRPCGGGAEGGSRRGGLPRCLKFESDLFYVNVFLLASKVH